MYHLIGVVYVYAKGTSTSTTSATSTTATTSTTADPTKVSGLIKMLLLLMNEIDDADNDYEASRRTKSQLIIWDFVHWDLFCTP